MEFNLDDPIFKGILIATIGAILSTLLIYLIVRLKKSSGKILSSFKQKVKEQSRLENYRTSLEHRTLRINHPWMKEDQTLNDILVPINFEHHGESEKEDLEPFLEKIFNQNTTPSILEENTTPRVLITGKPGSGKSIALRVIARNMWSIEGEIRLVPVLLNFSDIKTVKSSKEFENRIVERLEYFQFEKGKNNNAIAKTFVSEYLYTGKLLVLIDGYDEIEKSDRFTTSKFLTNFLGTYNNIPAIFSSRTAVYDQELSFDELISFRINMSPFNPFAVLKFLSQWKFEEGKSSHELFDMITGNPHLSELSSNPLMLTIIAFLYSLPKYKLPDNRVQFYEQCTRALLEEWDRSQKKDRANKYETHQKISILNKIAFDHISTAKETDELILEEKIFSTIKSEMSRLSLKVDEYSLMKDEIVLNSGLLQTIPPYEYKFPHRTFMEFFTAKYFLAEKNYHDIIELYKEDSEKWKEVLLLYLGLNQNKESSNIILEFLKSNFEDQFVKNGKLSIHVLNALIECAVPDPILADDILNLAGKYLDKIKPSLEVIEQLGFIASNPRWQYAIKAKEILLKLFYKYSDESIFQYILLALLHTRDNIVDDLILKNIKDINYRIFFASSGKESHYFIHKLLAMKLSKDDKSNIIQGLKNAGNFKILGSLLIESTDYEIKELSAFALANMSKLDGFFNFLDSTEIGLLDNRALKIINETYLDWGWRFDTPKTEDGKKIAILICNLSSSAIVNHGLIRKRTNNILLEPIKAPREETRDIHKLFISLITVFLIEDGYSYDQYDLFSNNFNQVVTKRAIKNLWKKGSPQNKDNFWNKFLNIEIGGTPIMVSITMLLYLVISILAIKGLFSNSEETNVLFYNFSYDPFTIKFLMVQVFGYSLICFVFVLIFDRKAIFKDWVLIFFSPHLWLLLTPKLKITINILIFFLSILLLIVSVLFQFSDVLFNAFVFFYYFLTILLFIDLKLMYRRKVIIKAIVGIENNFEL